MKKSILSVPLFTAVALMAQSGTPGPSASPNPPAQQAVTVQHQMKGGRHRMAQRLSEKLNLTPEQRLQVRAMFRDANAEAKPLRSQLHEERASLALAIKSGSEKQIDEITHQNADAFAKVQAIHAKTMAKVYSLLTADQKAKFDMMHSRQAPTKGADARQNN